MAREGPVQLSPHRQTPFRGAPTSGRGWRVVKWLRVSCRRFTVVVGLDELDVIVWAAPLVRKFINQQCGNLIHWAGPGSDAIVLTRCLEDNGCAGEVPTRREE